MPTAEVRRGQSSSLSLPVRTRCWSMRPSEDIIRIASCSPGISMENTATGTCPLIAAFSAIFMAKVVLPMEGRPAMMTRSERCRPEVLSSKSSKPVGTPVIELSWVKR